MKPSVENCMQWVERDKKVIAPCSHLSYFPLVVAEAKQDMVYDEDGNGYIDFLSSASSLNLGSGQPAVHAAVMDQMGKGTQYTIAYSYNRASIEYAERLTSVYPGGAAAKVCFGLCGSDSNDQCRDHSDYGHCSSLSLTVKFCFNRQETLCGRTRARHQSNFQRKRGQQEQTQRKIFLCGRSGAAFRFTRCAYKNGPMMPH